MPVERPLICAQLDRKECLSNSAQCFHLRFTLAENAELAFTPGQFLSLVATDAIGKQQTRAYSVASAPSGNQFDLCVNRVENGFFSNLLCDLEPGDIIKFHGPHGYFTPRLPVTDSIFIASGTGIAPVRSILQWLLPIENAVSKETCGKSSTIWLIHGLDDSAPEQHETHYYRKEFAALATKYSNFYYIPTVPDAFSESASILETHAVRLGLILPKQTTEEQSPDIFPIYAYICGLNSLVAPVRSELKNLGWHRKQIVFERYD